MEFSELALQKLIQLFPELTSNVVTFSDITDQANKGEDSDVSVGVFVLRFGQSLFYVPVLSKGEVIQPLDSIFNPQDQTFVPLTKAFVQQAISQTSNVLGGVSKIPRTVDANPSLYHLVTPPRTGKFVYSSASRLTEFLHIVPNQVKEAMLQKVAEDKSLYSALHTMFGLEDIFSALKPTASPIKAVVKPAIELITEGHGLENDVVKSILEKGYALRGENVADRVAVAAYDADQVSKLKTLGGVDIGVDREILFANGKSADAYLPKRLHGGKDIPALLSKSSIGDPIFGILSNGDYFYHTGVISRGEDAKSKDVLRRFFEQSPALTPKDVPNGSTIAILTPDLSLVGAYRSVTTTNTGDGTILRGINVVSTSVESYGGVTREHSSVEINAFRNCKDIHVVSATQIFLPYNALVIILGQNVGLDLETSLNAAAQKLEFTALKALGSAARIGFDGIEFIYNGKNVGDRTGIIRTLVIEEGLNPNTAESFIKQAEEKKFFEFFLSKKADFNTSPDSSLQGGEPGPEQINPWDLQNGMDNVKDNVLASAQTQDQETVETTIISELLQVADMKEYVAEYLPEIKQAIDKLGRTLFLSRLNIGELSETHSANEIISFISNLRNVYRMLGDNYLKLEQMVTPDGMGGTPDNA